MSHVPFFSIAIPTKNRPLLLGHAIRSVLEQTFGDLEVVVCDNSDPAQADATVRVVREFDDPRLRYVRTSGRLSMPDNWEFAMREVRGEYVGVLTDRSVFHPHAMATARREIEATGVPLVGWFGEHYGRGPSGRDFRRRPCSGRSWIVESPRLLDYFVRGHFKHASKRLPKLMTGICSRQVIDEIRSSAIGRICPPVAPDFTSGFLMLAHTDRMVLIDEALFVGCGTGNGSSFRKRGELADRFVRDLGMGTWQDLVDRMPTRACFPSAMVLNDLMRVKSYLPERFAPYDIDRVQYYLGCLADYERAARRGADLLSEDYDELIEGLNMEPPDVQSAVRTRHIYVRAATVLPVKATAPREDIEDDDDDRIVHPEFDTVFAALAWAASQRQARDTLARRDEPLPMPELDDVAAALVKPKRPPLTATVEAAATESAT